MYELNLEKEVLGFYISGHPLSQYESEVKSFTTVPLKNLLVLSDQTPVVACGIVQDCKTKLDRKNKTMAFVTLEDFSGTAEIVVFASIYEKHRDLLQPDKMVSIAGRFSARSDGEAKIICNEVIPLEQVWEKYGKNLHVKLDAMGDIDDPLLTKVNAILSSNPGDCSLYIDLKTAEDKRQVIRSRKLKVKPSRNVIAELRDLLGSDNVWMEVESQLSVSTQKGRYNGNSN